MLEVLSALTGQRAASAFAHPNADNFPASSSPKDTHSPLSFQTLPAPNRQSAHLSLFQPSPSALIDHPVTHICPHSLSHHPSASTTACDYAAMADSASTASGAPPKQKRSFFKKPAWEQTLDNAEDGDPMAMFDGSKQTFSAIMEEQDRARKKKIQEREEEEEELARKKELEAARRGKRRKLTRDESPGSDEHRVRAKRDDRKK